MRHERLLSTLPSMEKCKPPFLLLAPLSWHVTIVFSQPAPNECLYYVTRHMPIDFTVIGWPIFVKMGVSSLLTSPYLGLRPFHTQRQISLCLTTLMANFRKRYLSEHKKKFCFFQQITTSLVYPMYQQSTDSLKVKLLSFLKVFTVIE